MNLLSVSLTGPQLYCSQTVPGSHDCRIKATVHEAASTLQRALRVTPTFQPYSHSDVFLPISPTFKSIHPLRPYSGPLPPEAAQAQQSHDWTISPGDSPSSFPLPTTWPSSLGPCWTLQYQGPALADHTVPAGCLLTNSPSPQRGSHKMSNPERLMLSAARIEGRE